MCGAPKIYTKAFILIVLKSIHHIFHIISPYKKLRLSPWHVQIQAPLLENPIVRQKDPRDGPGDHRVAGEEVQHEGHLAGEGPPGTDQQGEEKHHVATATVGEGLRSLGKGFGSLL